MYSENEIIDMKYVAFKLHTGIGRRNVKELIDKGVINNYRELLVDDDIKVKIKEADITDDNKEKLINAYKKKDEINKRLDEYISRAEKLDMKIISKDSDNYPWAWKQITGMPDVVFAVGQLELLDKCYQNGAVSIVGSRKPSRYAQVATKEFSEKLSDRGIVIVSGMASGIDRTAHVAAINRGNSSIGIVPGGVDVIYPDTNADLYKAMSKNGLILSEMPPGQEVIKQYFPSRNRLISALSDVTLIMEAGEYSGTLHTASFAAAQGKDVLVLPNSIYETNSIGGLALIRDGAEILLDVNTVIDRVAQNLFYRIDKTDEDDIEHLRELAESNPENLEDSEWKLLIVDCLSAKTMNIDDLNVYCKIPFDKLALLVSELEKESLICQNEGKYVLTFKN